MCRVDVLNGRCGTVGETTNAGSNTTSCTVSRFYFRQRRIFINRGDCRIPIPTLESVRLWICDLCDAVHSAHTCCGGLDTPSSLSLCTVHNHPSPYPDMQYVITINNFIESFRSLRLKDSLHDPYCSHRSRCQSLEKIRRRERPTSASGAVKVSLKIG